MDNSSLIMGAILLALVLIPVIYLSQANRRRNKKILKDQLRICVENNLHLSEYEIWENSFLVIDQKQSKLYFVEDLSTEAMGQVTAPSDYSRCKAVNSSRNVKSPEGNYSVVEKLELELLPKENNKIIKVPL